MILAYTAPHIRSLFVLIGFWRRCASSELWLSRQRSVTYIMDSAVHLPCVSQQKGCALLLQSVMPRSQGIELPSEVSVCSSTSLPLLCAFIGCLTSHPAGHQELFGCSDRTGVCLADFSVFCMDRRSMGPSDKEKRVIGHRSNAYLLVPPVAQF
ncbi:hypothetical protein DPX16_11839 [Anabarilius grahami]|uniref:Uncharacterized protein n=1 Tax=Anabarilius grahami TaxID=495550 RepID=A0A3N0Z8U0_ANAGA|nr:hypothetical protein DPX16_11839 [Anabarilius grahami]